MERDTVQDPVCGMRLLRSDAAVSVGWRGDRYYFCCEACCDAFEKEPERHVGGGWGPDSSSAGRSIRLPLFGVACVAGDRLPLERALRGVAGVFDAYVNPVTESAHLTVDPDLFQRSEAVDVLERFGARTVPDSD